MMDELVQKLSAKTGLAPDKAQEVINVVISHLKEKLPAPLASGLDSLLASGPSDGSNFMDKAKSVAASLQGMFGNKS